MVSQAPQQPDEVVGSRAPGRPVRVQEHLDDLPPRLRDVGQGLDPQAERLQAGPGPDRCSSPLSLQCQDHLTSMSTRPKPRERKAASAGSSRSGSTRGTMRRLRSGTGRNDGSTIGCQRYWPSITRAGTDLTAETVGPAAGTARATAPAS